MEPGGSSSRTGAKVGQEQEQEQARSRPAAWQEQGRSKAGAFYLFLVNISMQYLMGNSN